MKFIAIAVWLCTWPAHFLTGRAIFVLNTPCRAISSREVTKEQTANLYHRNFTSAGYSASSVEKYHYPSDCHRRNRGNLLLIPGVLAVLKCRSHGVPDKVAKIIRIKVLVNDLFSCQSTSERLPFSQFGINPFTCLKWESVFWGVFFQNFLNKFFANKKAAYLPLNWGQ